MNTELLSLIEMLNKSDLFTEESINKMIEIKCDENNEKLNKQIKRFSDAEINEIIELLGVLEIYIEPEGLEILEKLNKYFL